MDTAFHPVVRLLLGEVGQGSARFGDGGDDHVPARSGDDLSPPGIEQAHVHDFRLHRGPADARVAFHEGHPGSVLRCSQRRADSCRTATYDHDVIDRNRTGPEEDCPGQNQAQGNR